MFKIVQNIIGYTSSSGYNSDSTILYICGSLVILLTIMFIDLIYRVFRNFWR